jgi:hypothetical protein
MGGSCSAHRRDEKCIQKTEEMQQLNRLGVDKEVKGKVVPVLN